MFFNEGVYTLLNLSHIYATDRRVAHVPNLTNNASADTQYNY